MDKSWMQKQKWTKEYQDGVEAILNFAFQNASLDGMILCPCKNCRSDYWRPRDVVQEHLVCDGFEPGEDNLGGMLRGVFNMHDQHFHPQSPQNDPLPDSPSGTSIVGDPGENGGCEEPTGEAAKFYKLFDDMNEPLYEGSKCSKLAFSIRLFHLKCLCGMTGKAKQESCDVCGNSRWEDSNTNETLNEDDGEVEIKKKPAKKAFDSRFPDFASDPRNVRLGLAADGFNPFKLMSTTYSTWPVVLINYNLPPWIGMKQPAFILSMIIPGDKGPGNDIDIYLQPLIHELKQLWEGVETYDSSRKQNFHLRAALLWTINDFPAYAYLSGWSTRGRYACPCCAAETCSKWLSNGKKFCYMGHRWWLDADHHFRFQNHLFDNTIETREPPSITYGSDILSMLMDVNFTYGKANEASRNKGNSNQSSQKRVRDVGDGELDVQNDAQVEDVVREADLWKKRSIFFELDYWQHNLLRHNLDVMHIEKNVCENIVATILNVDGKSKDNLNSRLDLVAMGIRNELQPQLLPNGKTWIPPACYAMSKDKKDVFFHLILKISRFLMVMHQIYQDVSMTKERKLSSLKSHDYHILLHDLLPLALRSAMSSSTSKQVTHAILELSNIFKELCGKLFQSGGQAKSKAEVVELDSLARIQAHRYVLHHHELMEPFRVEYKNHLRANARSRRPNPRELDKLFIETFHDWIVQRVRDGVNVTEEVLDLARGPDTMVKRYSAYVINGFRFHTKSREQKRRTQNSGVVVTSSTISYASARDRNPLEGDVNYYGILNNIIELNYYNKFKVVLFRCDWADVTTSKGVKKDQFGFTLVNFSHLIHTGKQLIDEPYVFSSQVRQVFFSEDPKDPGWFVVLHNTPRDLYDMGEEASDDVERRTECFPSVNPNMPRLRQKNIRITSTAALDHAAGSGSSSSRSGQSQGLDIPEALEAVVVMMTNAAGNLIKRRGKTRLRDVAELGQGDRIFVQGNGEKFDLRGVSDIWLRASMAKKWRDHKNRLKGKYFDGNLTPDEVKRKLPEKTDIVRTQFYALVDYWFSPEGKEKAKKAQESREKQAHTHTSGSKSFARMAHEMSLESDGRPIGRLSVYVAAHTRANGSPMEATKETVARSKQLLNEEMKDCATTEDFLSKENSLYNEVLGPERYSRVRGFGLLPQSNRLFKNNVGASTSAANVVGPSEPAPSLQEYQSLVAKLAEMQEMHIREQAKAQAVHASLMNQLNDLQQVVYNIQRGNGDMQDAEDEDSEAPRKRRVDWLAGDSPCCTSVSSNDIPQKRRKMKTA
ncbi:Transposon, En/Spm-like protein [Corchorus capsularis]|uniref:Transposon, En/Spm-like protein n=2 Tax=Corchorus capsularis TaxID=210143 RepID=A0A1R3HEL3_COCAP|nr:Transposon, En/Spm-like protein [Corchorus capsularis]